jgi:hypothetical protein
LDDKTTEWSCVQLAMCTFRIGLGSITRSVHQATFSVKRGKTGFMDGDEERSSGVALCDDRPETEAEASGDAAQVDVDEEPSAEPVEDAPVDDVSEAVTPAEDLVDEASDASGDDAPDDADGDDGDVPDPADDVVAADDDAPVDDAPVDDADEGPSPDDADVPAPAEVVLADEAPDVLAEDAVSTTGELVPVGSAGAGGAMAVFEFDPPEMARVITLPRVEAAPRSRGSYVRRGVAALVGVGFVALAVTAFSWIAPSPEAANRRFVAAAQSEGHLVTSDEQQSLLVTAARKICDRRYAGHISDEDRRATALTSAEIGAVGAAFGADTRDFTSLALKTYCSR